MRPATAGPSSRATQAVRGGAGLVEEGDRLAALDQRHRDEPDRGDRAPETHDEPDQPAVEVVGAGVEPLVDGVGQPPVLAVGAAVAHQVEGDAAVRQDLGVEAGDQPLPRAAVQRGRNQMPDRETGRARQRDRKVGEPRQQDGAAGARGVGVGKVGERGDEVGARGRRPDGGLADDEGDCQHDRAQQPGLAPALGQPIGRDQPPERRAAFHGSRFRMDAGTPRCARIICPVIFLALLGPSLRAG